MPIPWSPCAAPEPVSDTWVEEGAGVEDGVLGIEADVIELMTEEAMEDNVSVAEDDAADSVDDIFQDGWSIRENVKRGAEEDTWRCRRRLGDDGWALDGQRIRRSSRQERRAAKNSKLDLVNEMDQAITTNATL